MLEPLAAMLFEQAAIDTNDQVLDVGCGCGATTLAAARPAAAGNRVGVDLSVPCSSKPDSPPMRPVSATSDLSRATPRSIGSNRTDSTQSSLDSE
jgi:hypothetical protein